MKLNKFFDNCYVYETVDKSVEWLKQRKTGIGGSEASIILNINPYKSPYQLFMEKKSNTIQHITREAIEKGNRLEQPLIDVFFALYPEYTPIDTMLLMSINAKKKRGVLTPEYIEDTKSKMDVFLMNDRITQDEYNELIKMLEVE